MKAVFTDPVIRNLEPAQDTDYVCMAQGEPGFGIRVYPGGTMTFFYQYKVDGQRRTLALGNYITASKKGGDQSLKTARELYKAELAKVKALRRGSADGVDPVAQIKRKKEQRIAEEAERSQALTVAELCRDYIEKYAMKTKKSWQEDKRILNKDVLPVWGKRNAKDISRRDVMQLLDNMQGRGDGIITNTFKITRRMFRYAVKKEIISTSPCYAFERGDELPRPVSRERNLTENEIKILWSGLDKTAMSKDVRRVLKLILVTGQRPGEVVSMHRKEITDRWWEFTPKETAITKEIPRQQRVYLTDIALQLIEKGKNNEYVFKSHKVEKIDPQGRPEKPRHITERAISHALRRNLLGYEPKKSDDTKNSTAAKSLRKNPFVVADDKKMDIEHFTPHDLRRTCATLISELGFVDATVDAILAHLKKGEIRTYNKNKYDKEKQEALTEWAIKLGCIIAGTEYRDPQQREADRKAEEEKDAKETKDNVIDLEERRNQRVV